MSNRDPLSKIITGRVHKESTLLKEASSKPNSDDAAAVIKERKPRKIRYAVLMAYQGKDYYGMQVVIVIGLVSICFIESFLDPIRSSWSTHHRIRIYECDGIPSMFLFFLRRDFLCR